MMKLKLVTSTLLPTPFAEFRLHGFEEGVIFDGVVDGRGGKDGVEAAMRGGGVVSGQYGLDHSALERDRMTLVGAALVRTSSAGICVHDLLCGHNIEVPECGQSLRAGSGKGRRWRSDAYQPTNRFLQFLSSQHSPRAMSPK